MKTREEPGVASKMKLLFFLGHAEAYNVDASERALNEMTVMMDKSWEVHLTNSRKISYQNLTCNYDVHEVKFISSLNPLLSRPLFLLCSIYKGVKIVRKCGIHAVVTKGSHLVLGSVAYLVSRMTRRKCIVRVNEDEVLAVVLFFQMLNMPILKSSIFVRAIEAILRKMENFVLKSVDWIVTHGPMDYQKIRKLTTKVTFVPLWVDVETFRSSSKNQISLLKKELLGIEEEVKVILFVGRFHPEKNVETLFYAYKKLLGTHRNLILVMVGTGPEEEKCRSLVEELGLIGKVKFLGYIPHKQIHEYYKVADIYVLTSIWEEWSNTIMEAMASRVPVIAANVGGNPYLVKDKETGFLVPPRDPHVLADKIRYVLDHPKEMEKIVSNAYERIRKFDKRDIGELYKKTIAEAIRGREPISQFEI